MAMTVRFTEEQDSQLTALAEIWGVSKQQALARSVEKSLTEIDYNRKVEEAIERTLSRYGDLLRRLGE